jgi:hypothetical protein
VDVQLLELPRTKVDKYIRRLPKTAPERADIRITDGSARERASAVERVLPDFGLESRYIVRSFPRGGRQWVERVLIYRTSRYLADIRLYGSADSEAEFLAFAREVRDLAKKRLK